MYYQLEQMLRKSILTGKLKPGQSLPPERVLCEEYGVRRITVRQPLLSLENDDLIIRERGRGTFVADHGPSDIPLNLCRTFEDLFVLGAKTRLKIESRKLVKASKQILESL
jgi:GntR family transcriptional regulator